MKKIFLLIIILWNLICYSNIYDDITLYPNEIIIWHKPKIVKLYIELKSNQYTINTKFQNKEYDSTYLEFKNIYQNENIIFHIKNNNNFNMNYYLANENNYGNFDIFVNDEVIAHVYTEFNY